MIPIGALTVVHPFPTKKILPVLIRCKLYVQQHLTQMRFFPYPVWHLKQPIRPYRPFSNLCYQILLPVPEYYLCFHLLLQWCHTSAVLTLIESLSVASIYSTLSDIFSIGNVVLPAIVNILFDISMYQRRFAYSFTILP